MICAALLVLVAGGTLLWRRRRARSDQRRQWLGLREQDWTSDELAVMRTAEVADVAA